MKIYIYALCDPRNGEIRYVGKTNNPHRRYISHITNDGGDWNPRKSRWIRNLSSLSLKPDRNNLTLINSAHNSDIGRMIRYCICGVPIPIYQPFCVTCKEIYGTNRKGWPEWLQVWMANYKRELDQENLHPHISLESMLERERL